MTERSTGLPPPERVIRLPMGIRARRIRIDNVAIVTRGTAARITPSPTATPLDLDTVAELSRWRRQLLDGWTPATALRPGSHLARRGPPADRGEALPPRPRSQRSRLGWPTATVITAGYRRCPTAPSPGGAVAAATGRPADPAGRYRQKPLWVEFSSPGKGSSWSGEFAGTEAGT